MGGGNTTIDAYAVYQSGLVEFSKTRTEEKVTQFLESYKDRCSQYLIPRTLTLDEVISMVTFHLAIIKSLAQHYAGWVLDNLTKETKDPQQSYEPLSRTEETRVVRALYRFQLYCNLFGINRSGHRSWLNLYGHGHFEVIHGHI